MELKMEFVKLRAEGKSYAQISDTLHIAKSTCTAWEQELCSQIEELKRTELATLCEAYGMTKKARILSLGETLKKIDSALEEIDFRRIEPDKLLSYKMKYTDALKAEYASILPLVTPSASPASDIMGVCWDLLNRTRTGEITKEQAEKEIMVISNTIKAFETVELARKIEAISNLIRESE
jgi:hypothetical protein